MPAETSQLAAFIREQLLERNHVYGRFFAREAERIAPACHKMADRFLAGGRLLAFGRGPYSTDAQHVSVEFIHPIIVGKRALPALDLSAQFKEWMQAILGCDDIVMGFGPPDGDPEVRSALAYARSRGAMTFALPGDEGDFAVPCFAAHPFQHQEMMEILYHTLWETVHVFFEHRELRSEAGDASFLYPFLGGCKQETSDVTGDVAASIRMKVADDARLREQIAREETEVAAGAALAMAKRVARGGKLILFGNGGSGTDANDWALDCVCPPPGLHPIPAVSLSAEPAVLTVVANDVGTDAVFLRQLIAQAGAGDTAVAISTSGGSRNLMRALEEARRRNLLTVALLGYDGGEILRQGLADFPIVVRCDYIPRIQEAQASVYHILREAMDAAARA
jgi:D-sedoheptulose 7-phosphate isomerase